MFHGCSTFFGLSEDVDDSFSFCFVFEFSLLYSPLFLHISFSIWLLWSQLLMLDKMSGTTQLSHIQSGKIKLTGRPEMWKGIIICELCYRIIWLGWLIGKTLISLSLGLYIILVRFCRDWSSSHLRRVEGWLLSFSD